MAQPKTLVNYLDVLVSLEAFVKPGKSTTSTVRDGRVDGHVQKAVLEVIELVAVLLTICGMLSFLADVYGIVNPSGK